MTNTQLSTLSPVVIDTFLWGNYQLQTKLWAQIASHTQYIERLRARKVPTASILTTVDDALAELEGYRNELDAEIMAAAPYQVEYARRPWNRYYLVTNTNGHVHRGLDCQTCFRDTQYGWLVELADCDEDAMIEEWGERACTVCFPEAPTNPNFHRPARIDRETKDARVAEKAARQAAKDAKSITDVDGSPLELDHGVIATKIAARNELSNQIQNVVFYGGPDYEANVRQLAAALEAVGFDWKPAAARALKRHVKEATKPFENRYGLLQEQIDETNARLAANVITAEALIKELLG